MFTHVTLQCLLLAVASICVFSTPVPAHNQQASSSGDKDCPGQCTTTGTFVGAPSTHSILSEPHNGGKGTYGVSEHVTDSWADLSEIAETEGGADPDGGEIWHGGAAAVMQTGNEGSHGGRSGTSRAGGEAGRQKTLSETTSAVNSSPKEEETDRERAIEGVPGTGGDITEKTPATKLAEVTHREGEQRRREDMNTHRAAVCESAASSTLSPKPEGFTQTERGLARERKNPLLENNPFTSGREEEGSRPNVPSLGPPTQAAERTSPVMEHLGPPGLIQRGLAGSHLSPISSSLEPPLTSLPESVWPEEEMTVPSPSNPPPPDLGPVLTSKQEGPESLWTEPLHQSAEDTVAPTSEDTATEGTMSSEDLPLIFEPFDDVTPGEALAAAAPAPGNSQPPAATATGGVPLSEGELDRMVTVDADADGPSRAPPLLIPDWTSPWQTSGTEISEPIRTSAGGGGTVREPEDTLPTSGPSASSIQTPMGTVTIATNQPEPKFRSGLEELESEEEHEEDEDEEDEKTEESEEDSEEETTESLIPAPTRPPYSLIPPPPVWVQRNQGLMRSWVELIREKAGYVSGMLAPVGIGIAGALLIVGALYSIRLIHRRRKNSFKHQRRKARQTEQPREPGSNRQDQAMLLADSSEDEF